MPEKLKPVATVTRPKPVATPQPTPIVERPRTPLYVVPRSDPPIVPQPTYTHVDKPSQAAPIAPQPPTSRLSPAPAQTNPPAIPKEPTGTPGRNSSDKQHAYNVWLHESYGQLVAGSWMPKNAAKFRSHVKLHPPKLVYSPADGWMPNPNYQKGQGNNGTKSIGHSPNMATSNQ